MLQRSRQLKFIKQMYVAEYADIQKAGLTLWMFLRRDKIQAQMCFCLHFLCCSDVSTIFTVLPGCSGGHQFLKIESVLNLMVALDERRFQIVAALKSEILFIQYNGDS